MKKLITLIIFSVLTLPTFATIGVTPASNGTNLTPTSLNVSGGWATLNNIVITEGANNDIAGSQTSKTLVLSAPNNWVFNVGVGTLSFQGDIDDIVNPTMTVTASQITITLTTSSSGNSGINEHDVMTISGIQVQPIDPGLAPSQGNILRTGGTAVIEGGAVSDNLNYGTLSLDESNPLPVELSSFTASSKGKNIILNWETKTEIQNYGFDIEKAVGSKELAVGSWEKIGFVKGHGNSNSPKEYSFVDNKLTFGKYLYRLKQIDTDGGFEYSKVVEVDFSVTDKFNLEQNYPNPFNPATTIKFAFDKNTKAQLKVYNVLGIEVANLFNETVEAGKIYEINFNASQLSSGVYYYQLSGDNKTEIKKMILLK